MKLQNDDVVQFGSCFADAIDTTATDPVRSELTNPDERYCEPQLEHGDHRELGRNRESVCQHIDDSAWHTVLVRGVSGLD